MSAPNRSMYAILGFLCRRPMSGYDLKKAVEQSVGNFWKESYGQIYPILKRLDQEGLAQKADAGAGGKRARHLYSITPAGREALCRWLEEPTEPQQLRNELLLKLFFGGSGDAGWSRRQVQHSRDRLMDDLARYQNIHERLRRDHADDADFEYWIITLRYGERDTQALIQWCDETLAVLNRIAARDSSSV
ncbi:MAG: PadR family transcriptional regulator [Deltaproteobacteria bacterium]|nr:PadR family transcriptional regulator [Deltaproteobacteria bacterium]